LFIDVSEKSIESILRIKGPSSMSEAVLERYRKNDQTRRHPRINYYFSLAIDTYLHLIQLQIICFECYKTPQ
jgi:hypothetical protein